MASTSQDIELKESGKDSNVPVSTAAKTIPLTIPYIAVMGVGFALILTGSILATYYGKVCDECVTVDCGRLYCQRPNILLGLFLFCNCKF